MKKIILCFFSLLFSQLLYSQESVPQLGPQVPSYVSLADNVGKFFMYADGGYSADWYVGYNNCWTVKLPGIKKQGVRKAYIGAKLGRSKIESFPYAYDQTPIPGKIYMALNKTPVFTSEQTFFLVESKDIPRETLPDESIDGTDSSRWFWTEVPLDRLSETGSNYIALWSSSKDFVSSSSAPIVAASPSADKEQRVWLSRSIKGNPPSEETAFDIPISGLVPAIAVKLVPENSQKVAVRGFNAVLTSDGITASFAVSGLDIEYAWLEISFDKFDWQRVTRYMLRAPYVWTFKRSELSGEMFYMRAAASDSLENTGYSKEITVPAYKK